MGRYLDSFLGQRDEAQGLTQAEQVPYNQEHLQPSASFIYLCKEETVKNDLFAVFLHEMKFIWVATV